MITYLEAQKKIVQHARALPAWKKAVQESIGCVIASDLRSPISLPCFDNSAMDGFALRAAETESVSVKNPARLEICGSIRAGLSGRRVLKYGKVFKIMTGAPMPAGADAVLEKEKAFIRNGFLVIAEPVQKDRHVRYHGEEISKGSCINLRDAEVTPGVVGFLSSLGVGQVFVHEKPRVSLIATGDELISCGKKLGHGQIYDSNTPMLLTALKSLTITPELVKRIADRKRTLKAALSKSVQQSDIVILTGGVSVGDYDHVKELFSELGVKSIFWKVRQKPGKPVFFGKKGRVLVFGLPGNPASAHACFYQYVYPAIRRLMGHSEVFLPEEKITLKHSVRPDREKTLFLKASLDRSLGGPCCEALGHQGSHMLSSLCRTDGFIVVPPGNKTLTKGQKIQFQYLPEAARR